MLLVFCVAVGTVVDVVVVVVVVVFINVVVVLLLLVVDNEVHGSGTVTMLSRGT